MTGVFRPARRALAWLACSFFLLAPISAAAPTAPAVPGSTLRVADQRIAAIAFRIATRGASLCPDRRPLTGMLLHHLAEYDPAGQRIMIERHALDRGPGILSVVEDSPAARAGIAAGDVLLAVNGYAFPDPRAMTAEKRQVWRRQANGIEDRIEAELERGPATVRLLRGGVQQEMTIEPARGCPARVRLARSDQLNAFADEGRVILTTRMLDLARSDDELAIVLGHELAHVVLRHDDRLEAEKVPKGLLRGFGANARRVYATEVEADRLGLELAWAAGYDVAAAADLWRRYYAAQGMDLAIFRTHPSLGARETLLKEVVAELEKRAPPSHAPL